jgi:hypothetical protein
MFSIKAVMLIMLPFLLVIAAGTLIRKRGNPDTAGRRYFLFLLWTGAGLWAAIPITSWLMPVGNYGIEALLAPITIGVMALIFLHLREFSGLRRKDKALFFLAIILLLGLTAAPPWAGIVEVDWNQAEIVFIILAILAVSGLLAAAWTLGKRHPTVLGLVALGGLVLFNGLGMAQLPVPAQPPPAWLPAVSVTVYLALPGLVVATVAILSVTGLKLLPSSGESGPLSRRALLWRLALAALLVGAFVYTHVWFWLWDGTDDGLRGLAIIIVTGAIATGAALVLAMTSSGWRRWTGLAFPVLLVGLLGAASAVWQGVSQPTHRITEARAARIQEALERFQARTGEYPAELAELVPSELWWISPPMILQGEGWCYEDGAGYYRLGVVYRKHWSAPSLSVRVYASAGNPPETLWSCDEKLAELRPKYEMAAAGPVPTPVPLPTSVIPGGRIAVEPAVRAASIAVGSWSPDGAYLVFGLTEYIGEQVEIDLHFLKAHTGEVCQASEPKWTAGRLESDVLRDHFAWLPDGRLLYVSEAGAMVALNPCVDDVEALASRYPATFTQAVSFDAESGRILLKTEDAYWLLDGISLEARRIPGIKPNAGESQWAWSAWSAGGERLAISLLDGQGADVGGTLFIVDGATGEVERSVRLEGASEATRLIVEWLTRDVLLVHSGLMVMDLRSDPPKMTDLLRDVFLLDVAHPTDFSSMDSISNPAGDGYYLGVRLNHPRNQAVYLYASEKNQVAMFEHDTHTLLFFPGGQWMPLSKWEDEPSYRDEYEMVWMDRPGESQRLVVEGHTPRSHPQLLPRYLPASSQLVFNSSQGVSLISIPDGEMTGFWELAGGGGLGNRILPSPGGEALVVVANGDGLYYIPLPPSE